jgi:hypothetical protein
MGCIASQTWNEILEKILVPSENNEAHTAYTSLSIVDAVSTSPFPFRASNPTAYHAEYLGELN